MKYNNNKNECAIHFQFFVRADIEREGYAGYDLISKELREMTNRSSPKVILITLEWLEIESTSKHETFTHNSTSVGDSTTSLFSVSD